MATNTSQVVITALVMTEAWNVYQLCVQSSCVPRKINCLWQTSAVNTAKVNKSLVAAQPYTKKTFHLILKLPLGHYRGDWIIKPFQKLFSRRTQTTMMCSVASQSTNFNIFPLSLLSFPKKNYHKGADYCAKGHQCHEKAYCVNLKTKYSCHCHKGFQGDGLNCTGKWMSCEY